MVGRACLVLTVVLLAATASAQYGYGTYGSYSQAEGYSYGAYGAKPLPVAYGQPSPCFCPLTYFPVCANGIQYPSACRAKCEGAVEWSEGPCLTPGAAPDTVFVPVAPTATPLPTPVSLPGRRLGEQTALFGRAGYVAMPYLAATPKGYGYTSSSAGSYGAYGTYGSYTPAAPACPCPFIYDPVCTVTGIQYSNSCEAECAGLTPADFSRPIQPTDFTHGPCTTTADALGGQNPTLSDPGRRRHLRDTNIADLTDAELAALLGVTPSVASVSDTPVSSATPSPVSSIGAASGTGIVAPASPPPVLAPAPAPAPSSMLSSGGYTGTYASTHAYGYGYGGSAMHGALGGYNPTECNCPFLYTPVCTLSGVQYSNGCTALCAGLQPSDWTDGPCPKPIVDPTAAFKGSVNKVSTQIPSRRLLGNPASPKPVKPTNNTAVPDVDPIIGKSVLIPANNTAIDFAPSSSLLIQQTAPVDDGGFVSAPVRNRTRSAAPASAPSAANNTAAEFAPSSAFLMRAAAPTTDGSPATAPSRTPNRAAAPAVAPFLPTLPAPAPALAPTQAPQQTPAAIIPNFIPDTPAPALFGATSKSPPPSKPSRHLIEEVPLVLPPVPVPAVAAYGSDSSLPAYGYGSYSGYGGAYAGGFYLSSEYLGLQRWQQNVKLPAPMAVPAPAPTLFAPTPAAVSSFGEGAAAVVSGQMIICAATPTVGYVNAPVIMGADLSFAIQAHFVETTANAVDVPTSDIRAGQATPSGVAGCLVPPASFGGFDFQVDPQPCCCASADSVFIKPFDIVAASAQQASDMVQTLGLASLSHTFADSFSQFDQLDGSVCASLLNAPTITLSEAVASNPGRRLAGDGSSEDGSSTAAGTVGQPKRLAGNRRLSDI